MREVSERTFKTYAREAVKELSKTDEPQPTPEDADREIDYNGYKPEQDYSEEDTKAGEEMEQAEKIVTELVLDRLEAQLTELEELEEESDRADDEWDKDPLNLELEEASTKAYTREWNAYIKASQTLAAIIGMDTKTTRQMLQRGSRNRQKVRELLKRRQKSIKRVL